jgi:hypothetical protein
MRHYTTDTLCAHGCKSTSAFRRLAAPPSASLRLAGRPRARGSPAVAGNRAARRVRASWWRRTVPRALRRKAAAFFRVGARSTCLNVKIDDANYTINSHRTNAIGGLRSRGARRTDRHGKTAYRGRRFGGDRTSTFVCRCTAGALLEPEGAGSTSHVPCRVRVRRVR